MPCPKCGGVGGHESDCASEILRRQNLRRAAARRSADEGRGLYQKFVVRRTDGSSGKGRKHHACKYFVLDLDHDPCAPAALRAYAAACRERFPILAADLDRIVDDLVDFGDPYAGEMPPGACGTFKDLPEVPCACGRKGQKMRVHFPHACYPTIGAWKEAKAEGIDCPAPEEKPRHPCGAPGDQVHTKDCAHCAGRA